MDDASTFLFAGGGTGGHLFPGLAVAEALSRRTNSNCVFVGSKRDVEKQIVATAGFNHVALSSPPSTLLRRNPLRFFLDYRRARRAAITLMRDLQPSVVIGLGGFASVPVVRAAHHCRIPYVLLEQNAVAGRATQWLSRGAAAICHTFVEAVPTKRRANHVVVTGNPVRQVIVDLAKLNAVKHTRPNLLILGGSQGSTAINNTVIHALSELQNQIQNWTITHQTGPKDADRILDAYAQLGLAHEVAPFFDDLPQRYATTDCVVSRAGATTLSELACAAVPAILIPYPRAVRNHQQRNAEALAQAGAATIVPQQRDPAKTSQQLTNVLQSMIGDETMRRRQSAAMRLLAKPDAADRVTDCVLKIAGLQHCDPRHGAPNFAKRNREVPSPPEAS